METNNNPHAIPDLKTHNAKWTGPIDDGKLVFSEIKNKKKQYPLIKIEKISLPDTPSFDPDFYNAVESQYNESGLIPPIRIRFDNVLLNGYEIYLFCKSHKIKNIPINQKIPTDKQIRETICHKPAANKTYRVKSTDGRNIYISRGQYHSVMQLKQLCMDHGLKYEISPNYKFTIIDESSGIIICKDANTPGDAGFIIKSTCRDMRNKTTD